jgi:pilus assembly protein CpaB
MSIRTIATIAVAALLGLLAVFLLQNYLAGQRAADRTQAVLAGTTPVVVAAQPIGRGVALQPQLLKVVRYPQGSVPAGALTDVGQASQGGQRLALRAFAPNEPILGDRITTPGGKLILSAVLTPGMRAVTFRSDDVAGVAGFVLPGDKVDILLTRSLGGNSEQSTITQVLAQNIKILAVDQLADQGADKPVVARSMTIEVTPELAQSIRLAQSVGSVSLALRQIGDETPVVKTVATVRDLGYSAATAPVAKAAYVARPIARPRARPSQDDLAVRITRGTTTTFYKVIR